MSPVAVRTVGEPGFALLSLRFSGPPRRVAGRDARVISIKLSALKKLRHCPKVLPGRGCGGDRSRRRLVAWQGLSGELQEVGPAPLRTVSGRASRCQLRFVVQAFPMSSLMLIGRMRAPQEPPAVEHQAMASATQSRGSPCGGMWS